MQRKFGSPRCESVKSTCEIELPRCEAAESQKSTQVPFDSLWRACIAKRDREAHQTFSPWRYVRTLNQIRLVIKWQNTV